MQRVSSTARHRVGLPHLLLIATVAAAVVIMFVGAVQFSFQLPIELD